jgi:YHS domain-containing protein
MMVKPDGFLRSISGLFKKGRIMKNYLILTTLILIFFMAVPSSAQEKKSSGKEAAATEVKAEPVNSICPVSAEEVDGEITYEYEGKTYALCCKSCLKKFKADPEKYISRLSEDGKSIQRNKGAKK